MEINKDKVLSIYKDQSVFSQGYRLYRLKSGRRIDAGSIIDPFYSFFSRFSLTRRFFRAEITNLYDLSDGSQLCIAKKGIFKKKKGENVFKKCFKVLRGSRPMNLCILEDDTIFFGEYFANMDKKEVHVYCSRDKGLSWEVVYTFAAGNINHIHGLYFDKYTNNIWLATGDRENECIIGYTKDQFKTFETVFRGGQEYRSCLLFFYEKYIVFATDSQYMKNSIKKFDRKTLKIEELQPIQGPAIKGGQVGDTSFLTTDVEPSEVNLTHKAHVWVSKDGLHWQDMYSDEKDCWNPTLFQLGSFVFPNYKIEGPLKELYFSGKALKKTDNKTIKITL